MEIKLEHSSTIEQIQLKFNKRYPNLWIDFYLNTRQQKITDNAKVSPTMKINTVSSSAIGKTIHFSPEKTVDELKEEISATLELVSNLLRKSDNVWVSAQYTGKWTLERQNSEGQQVSSSQ